MSAPNTPRDSAIRDRAASDTAVNLIVSAGAGTGKTTLLISRILNAVGSGAARLPEIAAITFTEKAAGELRHRLAAGLDALAAEGGAAGERADAARRVLDRATVSTIHAFCADLLRSHPIESGLPPTFRIDRGDAIWRASAPDWALFVAAEMAASGGRGELWGRVLASVTLSDATRVARALVSGGIPDGALAGDVASLDARAALGGEALRIADALAPAAETPGLTPAPRAWILKAEGVLRLLATDGAVAARRAIDGSKNLRKRPEIGTKVAPPDADALRALIGRARGLIAALAALDEAAASDLLAAVVPFAREARRKLVRSGLIDFDAVLVRARDLLRDHVAVREGVKRRFRMLLLDEFQDTDPLQYEIVFFAAEREDDAARDAYATRLSPGRLFIVGDAKQSIYRFRGADYAAYRRAVGHVLAQGGLELSLTTNFRSTASVLAPINDLFRPPASPSWKPSDYLPVYEPIEPHRQAASSDPAVEVWTAVPGPGSLAAERRRLEAAALARELASRAGRDALRYSDVLVLFRSFREVGPYLRALRKELVPFVVSGGRTFFERTEIVQAIAVLRAVADPDDEAALLGFLRSPAGGVDDRELAAHALAHPHGTWRPSTAVNAQACPALAEAIERLAFLRRETSGVPVDTAIRRVVAASELLTLSGLAFEAAQRVANIEKLLLAAGALARDGALSLVETLDAIEESLEFEEEGDSPLADETVDAVRVMTIHKAKGLEAKLVVLADAAAERRPPWDRDWSAGMAGSYVRLAGPGLRNGADVAAARDDAAHDAAEHLRLLYVALTRARDRLIVLAGGSRSTPWIDALAAWGYMQAAIPPDGPLPCGTVHHRVLGAPEGAETPVESRFVESPESVVRYDEAVAACARLAAPEFRSPSAHEAMPPNESASDDALRPDLAREVGTLVHARLAGAPAAAADTEASREAEALIAAFEASPLASRHLALDVIGREIPVLLADAGSHWRGAIDLLYREPDGVVVVVDFKTDASSEGASVRHAPQLQVYVKAVERALPGSTVRAELWMLRTGEVLRLDPAQTSSR